MTIDEQIIETESRAEAHRQSEHAARMCAEASEKRLAELRALKASESRTAGQRVAEELVKWDSVEDSLWLMYTENGGGDVLWKRKGGEANLRIARAWAAEVIDAERASAKAEEREACANLVLETIGISSGACREVFAAAIRARGAQ